MSATRCVGRVARLRDQFAGDTRPRAPGASDIDGRNDMILQIRKTALQQHGGARIGDRHKYAAEQIAIADVNAQRSPTAISADAADGRRRFERPIQRHAEPEREADERDEHRQPFDPHVRADPPTHRSERAANGGRKVGLAGRV